MVFCGNALGRGTSLCIELKKRAAQLCVVPGHSVAFMGQQAFPVRVPFLVATTLERRYHVFPFIDNGLNIHYTKTG